MRAHVQPTTLVALLCAACFAILLGLVQTWFPLSLASGLGLGLGLVVLLVVISSNELALYLLIFSMLLSPQISVGELPGGAALARGITFRLEDFLTAILAVAWLLKTAVYKELGLFLRTPLNGPIAAYAVATICATGLGMIAGRVPLLTGSLFVLKYIQYFVLYFMVVHNLGDRTQFVRFLLALLATAAIVSLYGALQIPLEARVSAPFEHEGGEPNTFGGYLALMLALVGGVYLTSDSFRQKALLALLAAPLVFTLLFTFSRASYVTVVLTAGALFAWSDRKRLMASLFAISLALLPLLTPTAVVDRIRYTINQPVESGQIQVGEVRIDTSTSDRLNQWRDVLFKDWYQHPLFGWGVTGYRFLDAQYPRVLVETGLVGLAAFLWLQVTLLRRLLEIYRRSQDRLFQGVALGVAAGFVGLVTHSLGSNTFIIVRIMEPFWFLVGMVIMIPELERLPAAAVSQRESYGYRADRVPARRER